jgi:hypothetical protein
MESRTASIEEELWKNFGGCTKGRRLTEQEAYGQMFWGRESMKNSLIDMLRGCGEYSKDWRGTA